MSATTGHAREFNRVQSQFSVDVHIGDQIVPLGTATNISANGMQVEVNPRHKNCHPEPACGLVQGQEYKLQLHLPKGSETPSVELWSEYVRTTPNSIAFHFTKAEIGEATYVLSLWLDCNPPAD